MLNPSFPNEIQRSIVSDYIAPDNINSLQGNEAMDTGEEYRLQAIYGDEIWIKLERAGFTPESISKLSVLEVCAGTGFLTYHLLKRCSIKEITINDISFNELNKNRALIEKNYPNQNVKYVPGDILSVLASAKFDLIIGNSFLHHFNNVPVLLSHINTMLNYGGFFVSLHEPTPMSTVVEGGKILVYPLAVIAPGFVNNIARKRYKGIPSSTDLWMFEVKKLGYICKSFGFSKCIFISWHLFRPVVVQKCKLHLSNEKPRLSAVEIFKFKLSIKLDSILNRILPNKFFGSIFICCKKK